ncbi:hypothetical protein D9611_000634 [Ephemerocybe angulata]|uniref:F-box domain-containing protein n=1 Tax=Ephemerocybe angulata TaxID=980116 RepID=A0A8H5BMY5_9AGAR|nr:hypothetical protein D9611_000634 [Tulosesus angulatus]
MSAPKLQQDLDCKIARLEQDLIVLKRRRNALSPISQLPSELLRKIFYLSLHFLQADRNSRTKILPEDTRLSISHVDHHWRTAVLESPELWSEIHVRNTTKVEYLAIARNNSKMQPLYVDGYDINLTGAGGVRHILQTEPHRIKSVTLHAPIEVMRSLLPDLKVSCEAIEFLELNGSAVQAHVDLTQHDTFFNFPKLRHLRVTFWDTLLIPSSFHPPSLVRLEIYFHRSSANHITRSTFAALRTVASTLEILGLRFQSSASSQDILNSIGRLPIHMPRLDMASFLSNSPGILPELLSLFHVPPSFRSVSLIAQGSAANANEFQAITSALQRSYASIYSPNVLIVRQGPPPITPSSDAIEVLIKHRAGVTLKHCISAFLIPSRGRQPIFSSDDDHALPISFPSSKGWLFGTLRDVNVEADLPVAFWRAFAYIPTLSTIKYRVTRPDDGFHRALEEIVVGEGPLEGDEEVFPSLTAVCPTFRGTSIEWDEDYARGLAVLLGRAWARSGVSSPPLALLEFRGCSSNRLDDGTVRSFRSVVRGVAVWNDQRWDFRETSQ